MKQKILVLCQFYFRFFFSISGKRKLDFKNFHFVFSISVLFLAFLPLFPAFSHSHKLTTVFSNNIAGLDHCNIVFSISFLLPTFVPLFPTFPPRFPTFPPWFPIFPPWFPTFPSFFFFFLLIFFFYFSFTIAPNRYGNLEGRRMGIAAN